MNSIDKINELFNNGFINEGERNKLLEAIESNEILNNLSVDGIKRINGGEYKNIKIDGRASSTEDITAERVNVDGMFKLTNLEAIDLNVDGSTEAKSIVISNKLKIDGTIKTEKIKADTIKVDGVLTSQSIEANIADIDGKISSNTLLITDKIKIDGKANITDAKIKNISVEGYYTGDKLLADTCEVSGIIKIEELISKKLIINEMKQFSFKSTSSINKAYVNEAILTNIKINYLEVSEYLKLANDCHINELAIYKNTSFEQNGANVKKVTYLD